MKRVVDHSPLHVNRLLVARCLALCRSPDLSRGPPSGTTRALVGRSEGLQPASLVRCFKKVSKSSIKSNKRSAMCPARLGPRRVAPSPELVVKLPPSHSTAGEG